MISPLLVLAILSSALYFEAEALSTPYKCKECDLRKIYAYWAEHGGVPRHITERNIRCHPREVAFMSTQEFFDKDVTCAVMYHYAASHTIHYMIGEELSGVHQAVTYDWYGKNIEPLTETIRLEIARSGAVTLVHMCSQHKDAPEGKSQFVIRGDPARATEADLKAVQEVLVNTFNVTETLRTLSGDCRLPHEQEQTHDNSCSECARCCASWLYQ